MPFSAVVIVGVILSVESFKAEAIVLTGTINVKIRQPLLGFVLLPKLLKEVRVVGRHRRRRFGKAIEFAVEAAGVGSLTIGDANDTNRLAVQRDVNVLVLVVHTGWLVLYGHLFHRGLGARVAKVPLCRAT